MKTGKLLRQVPKIAVLVLIACGTYSSGRVLAQTQTTPALAATNTPIPVVTPMVDATVVVLQSTVATQQVEIQALQRDLSYEVRDLRWWFLVAAGVAAFAGVNAFQAFRGIGKQVRNKVQVELNKKLYQLDVTNLSIRLFSGPESERIKSMLMDQGFDKVTTFTKLDSGSLAGITIMLVTSAADEDAFSRFIEQRFSQQKRLKPNKAGFILYAPTGHRINLSLIDKYPATAVANTPWNLVSTLVVLARTITPPLVELEAEE